MQAITVLSSNELFHTIVQYQCGCGEFELEMYYLLFVDESKADIKSEFKRFHLHIMEYSLPAWCQRFCEILQDRNCPTYNRLYHYLRRLVYYAAAFGNVTLLEFLSYQMTLEKNPRFWQIAAVYGHISILEYLDYTCSSQFSAQTMAAALTANHVGVVQYLHEKRGLSFGKYDLSIAAFHGNLDVVKYICSRTEFPSRVNPVAVAEQGHLNIPQYLYDNKYCSFRNQLMDEAAMAGHLHVVEYLHEVVHLRCSSKALKIARKNGHYDVVVYLQSKQRTFVAKKLTALYERVKFFAMDYVTR